MKVDSIKTVTVTVTPAEADVGSAIPQDTKRSIYKIKVTNLVAGANRTQLRKIENGGASTLIDQFQQEVLGENWYDPDDLKEDSAPLYIVEGPVVTPTTPAAGTSHIRAMTDVGNAYMTLWYVDELAPGSP